MTVAGAWKSCFYFCVRIKTKQLWINILLRDWMMEATDTEITNKRSGTFACHPSKRSQQHPNPRLTQITHLTFHTISPVKIKHEERLYKSVQVTELGRKICTNLLTHTTELWDVCMYLYTQHSFGGRFVQIDWALAVCTNTRSSAHRGGLPLAQNGCVDSVDARRDKNRKKYLRFLARLNASPFNEKIPPKYFFFHPRWVLEKTSIPELARGRLAHRRWGGCCENMSYFVSPAKCRI